jgi:glycosyltransferase involved in cell wall biosynthesis
VTRDGVSDFLAAAATLAGADQAIAAFPLPLATLPGLARFAGAVFAAKDQVPAGFSADRAGFIHHPPYDWTLPAIPARAIVFCGPRRRIAAPMLRSAWRRGIRRIVYATPRGPKAESIAKMLARRGLEVGLHRVARASRWLDDREGRALEKIAIDLIASSPPGCRIAPVPGRILLANHSLSMGGAERQIVNTLVGLKQRGFPDVALACERRHDYGSDDPFGATLQRHGIDVAELAGLPLDDAGLPSGEGLPHSLGDDVLFWAGLLRQHRPQVLHAWQDATSVKAGLAAALVGVPRIVLAARNQAPLRFAYWLPWMRPVYRALARLPNVVMTNNSAAGARDYARWLDVPEDRIQVIYNALAPEALAPAAPPDVAALRARFGIAADAPVVGSIFRFYDEKNPLVWIATAAAVAARKPEARFLLVGEGPMRASMQEAARGAGIADRVIFAGEMPDPKPALAAMQVFLLASREEGLPNVVIEAQAQGVPVVTTRAGGAPEAIAPGVSGTVVDRADPAALAAQVLRILDDKAWAATASGRAKSFVAGRFGATRMLDETLHLYGLAP